jgi:hypothetical protein
MEDLSLVVLAEHAHPLLFLKAAISGKGAREMATSDTPRAPRCGIMPSK